MISMLATPCSQVLGTRRGSSDYKPRYVFDASTESSQQASGQSTTMSGAYLNKSKKSFRPKAQPKPPARREVAPPASEASPASELLDGNAIGANTHLIAPTSDPQPQVIKSIISSALEHNLAAARANSSPTIDLTSETAPASETASGTLTASTEETQASAPSTQGSELHGKTTDGETPKLHDAIHDENVACVVADSTPAVPLIGGDSTVEEQPSSQAEITAQDVELPRERTAQPTHPEREEVPRSSAPSIIPLPSARPRNSANLPITPPPSAASAKRDSSQLTSEGTPAESPQKRQRTGEASADIPDRNMPSPSIETAIEVMPTATNPAKSTPKGKRVSKKQATSRPDDKTNEATKSRAKKKGTAGNKQKTKPPRDEAEQESSAAADSNANAKGSRRRSGGVSKRKRHGTPDGAQQHRIVPTDISMAELCDDQKVGKVSSREMRLRNRDKDNAEKKRQAAQEEARRQAREFMNNPQGLAQSAQAGPSNTTTIPPVGSAPEPSAVPDTEDNIALSVPMTQIVDGQIVAVENSHIVDRHNVQKNPNLAYDENAPAILEDDLSKRVNNASYKPRKPSSKWTSDKNDLFWEGLRYFGMDFTTMRTLFQGMSRMDLKKKFIKEQRADLNFVNQVLKERKPVPTAEELQKLSGKVFREPKEVYAELKKDEAELMETQRRQEEADGEANKARERQVEEEGVRLGVEIAAKPPDQSGDEESGDEEILKEVSPTKEQDLENEANPVKSIEDTVDHADDTAKHTDGVSNDPESDNEADDENEVQEVQDDETDYGDEVE